MRPNMQPNLTPNLQPPSNPANNRSKEKKEPFSVKREIENFKNTFMEIDFPPEFESLDDPQKFQVITTLKHRIVDLVKSDAETQYSESLKSKMVQATDKKLRSKITASFKNILTSIEGGAKKESEIKNLESEIFQKLQTNPEYKDIVEKQLSQITTLNQNRNIYIDQKTNKPQITFTAGLDLVNTNENDMQALEAFNKAVNNFREMPYEWSQSDGSNKSKYEEAKKEYEKTRAIVLNIAINQNPSDKGKAMTNMLEFDNVIRMDQLLNTHPEVEQEFSRLGENADSRELLKTGAKFINTVSGKTWTNRALMALGYGARTAAKGAAIATSMTGITFAAAPVIGGAIGYWRGAIKGKEEIEATKKNMRSGLESRAKTGVLAEDIETQKSLLKVAIQNNDKKTEKTLREKIKKLEAERRQQRKGEAGNFSDATRLTKELNKLIEIIESAPDEKEALGALSMLSKRIDHTVGKIELGRVNFGDVKSSTKNQFELINTLNTAIVTKEANNFAINEEVYKRINLLLSKQSEKIEEKTKEDRGAFIAKHAKKGAIRGAGLATAGYAVRWLGEEMGWWGNHPEHSSGKLSSEKITAPKNSVSLLDKDTATKLADKIKNTLSGEDQSEESDTLRANLLKKEDQARAGTFTTEQDTLPENSSSDTTEVASTPEYKIPETEDRDTLPENIGEDRSGQALGDTPEPENETTPEKEALENKPKEVEIKVNKDAIVHKGKHSGITYAFRDQLRNNPELREKLDIDGDLNDPKYVAQVTRDIAIKTGYMDETGHEIRVKAGDKIAYELSVDEHGKIVVEEKSLDGTLMETHHEGDAFEKDIEKNYEYSDGKTHHYENGHEVYNHADNGDPVEVFDKNNTPWEQVAPIAPGKVGDVIGKLDYTNLDKLPGWDKFKTMSYSDFMNTKLSSTEETRTYNLIAEAIRGGVEQDEDLAQLLRNPNVKIESILEEVEKVNKGGNFIYRAEDWSTVTNNNLNKDTVTYSKKTAGYEEVAKIAGKEDLKLAPEEIQEVNKVYQTTLNKIFLPERGNNWNQWVSIKNKSAFNFINSRMAGDGGSQDALRNWALKIQDVTGVTPKRRFGLIPEDLDHYIMRALLHAKEDGVDLDRLSINKIPVPNVGDYDDLQPIGNHSTDHNNLEQEGPEDKLQPIGGKQSPSESTNETESLKPIKGKGAMETNKQNSADDLLKPIGGKNK